MNNINNQNNICKYNKFIIVIDKNGFESLINTEEIKRIYKSSYDCKTIYIIYKDDTKISIQNTVKEVYNKIYE